MKRRVFSFGVAVAALVGVASAALAQSGLPRVDTADAMKHIVKRVDPIYPPAAAAAKVGGTVIADIVIKLDGTVESVSILSGDALLHQAARDAILKWTFKPFLQNGRPARVLTIVDVRFPDPARDERNAADTAFRTAENNCERESQLASPSAVSVCAEFLRMADGLEPDRFFERTSAHFSYGRTLFVAGRVREALAEFQIGLDIRLKSAGPHAATDADTAECYAIIAIAHGRLGENAKADEMFAKAVSIFEAAIAQTDTLRDNYTGRFKQVLSAYQDFKIRIGQPAEATLLARKNAGLVVAAEPPPPVVRTFGSIQCWCAVSADDQTIRTAMRAIPQPEKVYFVRASERQSAAVTVFLKADHSTPGLRTGAVALIAKGGPGMPVGPDQWFFGPMNERWAQVPPPSMSPAALPERNEPAWPFLIHTSALLSPLTDTEIVDVVRLVRTEGEKTRAARLTEPRLAVDVQPWAIESILRGELDLLVVLGDPSGRRSQRITLRQDKGKWVIAEMR